MPNLRLPPLQSVNVSTQDDTRKSIHILFTQGDSAPVIRWLDTLEPTANDDLLGYVWMQSIRSNTTIPIAAWLNTKHPGKLTELNATLEIVKVLHSPRAWEGLKAQNLIPKLDYEEIAKITTAWNKNILGIAMRFRNSRETKQKMEPYFKECVATQINFLNHFVPSYRTKSTLLNIGLDTRAFSNVRSSVPTYGSTDPVCAVMQERAQAMAASSSPDMWLLASMNEVNVALSYYLSHSVRLSNWWHPLLDQLHPMEFKKENWQRYMPKTTVLERPVPDNIMVAYHLMAGIAKIREQISGLMATADVAQDVAFEELDLSAIEFDME